jgi:hypothetical protein
MTARAGVKIVDNPTTGKKERLKPFEDNFQLVSYLEYNDRGRTAGATLLRKGTKESYRVVFGFRCGGISPILSSGAIAGIYRGFEAFKDLPKGESLTLHFTTRVDDRQRQSQLRQLQENSPVAVLRLLMGGSRVRVRELTESGARQISSLNIYVTYTVEDLIDRGADAFDKILVNLERAWHTAIGSREEIRRLGEDKVLLDAYHLGLSKWEKYLANGIGLSVRPMTVDELWANDWSRLNASEPLPLPNYRTIDVASGDIESEVRLYVHPKSYLLYDSVPVAARERVTAAGKQTGVLVFAAKPDGWPDEMAQLRHAWDALSRERVHDTEYFCQLTRGNSRLLKEKLQVLTKQTRGAARRAAEHDDVDVAAELAVRETIESQIALFSDEEPLLTAAIVLIHRDTRRALDRACNDFISHYRRVGWVARETEYAHQIWLDTFATLKWERALTKPFNRRITYVTSEVPGILPLVRNGSLDDRGFELIASEGGNPVYLDYLSAPVRVCIFGRSGSGKSTLVADWLTQALAAGQPSTILDFPREDGTGSFDTLAFYLPELVSYVDIGDSERGWNLLEPPDLRGIPEKLQRERLMDFKEYLIDILFLAVLGTRPNASNGIDPDTIRSVLLLVVDAFYDDIEIVERFAVAFTSGFGSIEWSNSPTLSDLLPFCSLERLQLGSPTGETLKVLEFVRLKLNALTRSRLGKLLDKPTSFNAGAMMLIVALRGLKNDTDAAILSSMVWLGMIRRSLSSPRSVLYIDEAAVFMSFPPLALTVGKGFATLRKSGVSVLLAAQGPTSIARSAAAEMIHDNTDTMLVGKLNNRTVDDFIDLHGFPPSLIGENASARFGIDAAERYSQWLASIDGQFYRCRHYPSRELFTLVANNPNETEARRELMETLRAGDRVRALYELTERFTGVYRGG